MASRGGNALESNRFCTCCQQLLKNQAVYKRTSCLGCRAEVPLMSKEWGSDGWGRCPNCTTFLFREHCYCEKCGFPNSAGIRIKRKRQMEATRLADEAKYRRIAELEAELEATRAKLKKKEEEEEDLLLSQVDEEMLDATAQRNARTEVVLKVDDESVAAVSNEADGTSLVIAKQTDKVVE